MKRLGQHAFKPEDADALSPELVKACAADRFTACETLLKVSDKEGELVPCKIRDLFRAHYEASGEVTLSLKSRQEFETTSWDAMFYLDMVESDGVKVLSLNLTERKAQENFRRVKAFEQYRHPILKELTVTINNDEELAYAETRGSFKTLTIKNDSTEAQADQVGRTGTYQRVRFTEGAFSRHYKVIKKAVLATMPKTNRKFVVETTGNGAQGGFYDDFMEVVTHGQPHPTLPNCWVMGTTTAHFKAWFQHHQYRLAESPFAIESLPADAARALEEHERDHIEQMQRFHYSERDIQEHLNWRRSIMLSDMNLLSDAVGACRNMNREYPATYRHAFQSTGSAWMSMNLIDILREYYKRQNERLQLPIYLDFLHEPGKPAEPVKGNRFLVYAMPERGWKYRYCIFADVSAGHDDGDQTCGYVLDRHLLTVVAVFHGAFSPKETAKMMMALGVWYDYCLLNWENNAIGLGVTEILCDAARPYGNVYKGEPERNDLGAYGWVTTPETRRNMCASGKTYFEHDRHPIRNPYLQFYVEAAAFQAPIKKQDRPAAISGHDDAVMAFFGLVMTHLSMPAVEEPARAHTMKPGEANLRRLAGVTSGYRAAAQKRAAALSNHGGRR